MCAKWHVWFNIHVLVMRPPPPSPTKQCWYTHGPYSFAVHYPWQPWFWGAGNRGFITKCPNSFVQDCSICVLMYLYYIYLLISAMMDLLLDEIPPKFYERLRRRILSKVGDRFAYGMGCWMWHGEKKIGKMDPLVPYQNNGE